MSRPSVDQAWADGVRSRTSELVEALRKAETDQQRRQIAEDLVIPLTDYWTVHPHSAMEQLESAVQQLSIEEARPMVREVVQRWRKQADYDPLAGGNAGHCFLSALICSENFDIADERLVAKDLDYTLRKELHYPRSYRDTARKRILITQIKESLE